jgi:hypothetical protein
VKTVERSFRLEGPAGLGAKPRPELIGMVLAHLRDTLQDSVRMGFLHSSRTRGRIPAGIRDAADIRYIGHSGEGSESTVLRFEAPPFSEVAQEFFAQGTLWEDGPRADQTAFELLGAAIDDVGEQRRESSRFDVGLLRRIGSYGRLFKDNRLTRIVLPDASLPRAPNLDGKVVVAARELASVTPHPRRVRIAGRLDLMGASQGVLKIELRSGATVTALWDGSEPIDELKALFNSDVICEGTGVFRPSGTLLRIDATAIARASENDDFFRHLPTAVARTDVMRDLRVRAGEPSAYEAFLGSVPGEESDDEFAAAIAEMS